MDYSVLACDVVSWVSGLQHFEHTMICWNVRSHSYSDTASDSGRLASQHWCSENLKSCIENALFEARAQWKVAEGVGFSN